MSYYKIIITPVIIFFININNIYKKIFLVKITMSEERNDFQLYANLIASSLADNIKKTDLGILKKK